MIEFKSSCASSRAYYTVFYFSTGRSSIPVATHFQSFIQVVQYIYIYLLHYYSFVFPDSEKYSRFNCLLNESYLLQRDIVYY